MPRKGIHPLVQLVRIVYSNGSSVIAPRAWAARPDPRADPTAVVATIFLETDRLNHEAITGVAGRGARANVGRRARFENKFAGAHEPPKS